jgi:hypothetical protein
MRFLSIYDRPREQGCPRAEPDSTARRRHEGQFQPSANVDG